jgi:hypothetical protein
MLWLVVTCHTCHVGGRYDGGGGTSKPKDRPYMVGLVMPSAVRHTTVRCYHMPF